MAEHGEVERLVAAAKRRARSAQPLDRLRAAVDVADEVSQASQEALDRFVAEARDANHSWAEIGAVLDVTRQAAQQRFAGAPSDGEAWPPNTSGTVQAAFLVAQEDARSMGHNHLGTEHVLLGLLAQRDGLAAHVLSDVGVTREAVVSRIEQMVGRGGERRWESLGVAPKVKRALEAGRREARRLGHRCANTEHLLIGLCRSEDSVAVRILDDLGAPRETVVERVADALGLDPVALRSPARRRRRLLTSHHEE
ncbi:MAG: hypothetical protein M3Q31_18455 [Actinomycetota bacterium]|nr:hypothetical protein [Actinomycetota bacterium]